jgi:hypothetical protein
MNILAEAAQLLTGDNLAKMSQVLGADEDAVGKGLTAAVPAILTALNGKAQDPDGAASLFNLISNNFGGGLLDNLGAFLGNPQEATASVPNLLGTLFGDGQAKAEETVSKASGLGSALVPQLLSMAAPILLSMIGKHIKTNGLDINSFTSLLGDQMSLVRNNAPGLMGFLERIDANDDGSIVDDLGRLFNNFFGKKDA